MRVLIQILWGRVWVRANIKQQERLLAQEELHGDGRSNHSLDATDDQDTCRHAGAGVTRGDDGIGKLFAYECCRNDHRCVFAFADSDCRVLFHGDHAWTVDDGDIRWKFATSDRANDLLITDEGEVVGGILFGPAQAAWDNFGGTVVTTHRIEGEADSAARRAHCELGVGDVRVRRRSTDDLAAAIGSAL